MYFVFSPGKEMVLNSVESIADYKQKTYFLSSRFKTWSKSFGNTASNLTVFFVLGCVNSSEAACRNWRGHHRGSVLARLRPTYLVSPTMGCRSWARGTRI